MSLKYVPNSEPLCLSSTRPPQVYTKLKRNALFEATPSVVHFAGFTLNTVRAHPSTTLEATQGQIDGFFSQLPYKCHQNRVASGGD